MRCSIPHCVAIIGCILLHFLVADRSPALEWNEYHENQVSRFYTGSDRNFVGNGFDWSGVGIIQGSGGISGFWVTMISDQYFLSAHHIGISGASNTVHFYPTNNINDGFESATIDSTFGEQIAGSDLWLGRLTSAPSSAIKRYPLMKRSGGANYLSFLSPDVYAVGYRYRSDGAYSDYDRYFAGTNQILSLSYDHVTGQEYIQWNRDTSAGGNEVGLIDHDSSGPTFGVSPMGTLGLVGIHNAATGTLSQDISVPSYTTQIISEVPETVVVMTDLLGDLNGDYRVSSGDYSILMSHYNQSGAYNYNQGDLNGDGHVTTADYSALISKYGQNLFAPSDFDQNATVDKNDMLQIANHWHTNVAAKTNGDANGNGYVDGYDINVFNANRRYDNWTQPAIPNPIPGDVLLDDVVDVSDLGFVEIRFNQSCSAGNNWCEGADIDHSGTVGTGDVSTVYSNMGNYIPADINGDKIINNADLDVVLGHWLQSTSNGKADGDLNLDGVVNASDFSIMADWWGRGVGNSASQPTLVNVPEPSLGLLLLSSLSLFPNRKHRRY